MLRCGLRGGEALALRRTDIDFAAATIRVARSMSRREGPRPLKGRDNEEDGRTVPMPDDVAERLRRHLTEQPVSDIAGFVVTGPHGRPLRYTNWRNRTWTRITDLLDFDITPHDLRRTAATRLFREDRWRTPDVQAFLGHRDARITLEIYTKVNSADLPQPSRLSASR